MKKLTIFILISFFSNILSMEVDSNIDQNNIESLIFYLQSEMALPILPEFESYVNQIKSANDIFEFYKFFNQEKDAELKNMRLTGKLFNIIISDMYLKRINDKFEELKAKAIADCKNKSKEDLNKELRDILNPGMSLEEEELRECCKLILAGADVNLESQYGWTVLIFAVNKACIEIVKLLLDKNADVNFKSKIGWTALMFAVNKSYIEIAKLLLDKNVNIDLQNEVYWTALMIAVDTGCIEMVKLLLDKDANIDLQDKVDWTALMIATNNGYIKIAKLLLDKNAKTDIQNNKGRTALIIAENKGYNEIADLLRNKNN